MIPCDGVGSPDIVDDQFRSEGYGANNFAHLTRVAFSEVFTEKDVQFSERDSEDNGLTKGQVEYFKESKARDTEGNLVVVYHGTQKAGFTKFSKTANYFTEEQKMEWAQRVGINMS